MIKDYNLKKGDIVVADGIEYTYIKTDGMYSKWSTKDDDWVTGNFGELELDNDGKYRPVKECVVCGEKAGLRCSSCDSDYCEKHYKTTVMMGNCCSGNEKAYA